MFCIYRHVFRPQETVEPLPLCQLNPRPLENVRKKLSALSQSALLFLCQMLVGWKTNTNSETNTNTNTKTNTNTNSQSVRKNSLLCLHSLFFPLVEMCFLLVVDDKDKEKYRIQTQNRDKNTNTKINSQNARTKFCSISICLYSVPDVGW